MCLCGRRESLRCRTPARRDGFQQPSPGASPGTPNQHISSHNSHRTPWLIVDLGCPGDGGVGGVGAGLVCAGPLGRLARPESPARHYPAVLRRCVLLPASWPRKPRDDGRCKFLVSSRVSIGPVQIANLPWQQALAACSKTHRVRGAPSVQLPLFLLCLTLRSPFCCGKCRLPFSKMILRDRSTRTRLARWHFIRRSTAPRSQPGTGQIDPAGAL